MDRALIGLAGGTLSGALAGFILAVLEYWGKDLRDTRLRAAGMPLPSDRVSGRYYGPLAVLGGLNATVLVLGLDVPPIWAALSIFAVPGLFLLFLLMSVLVTWLGSSSTPSR